jgi:hypothetical protein
MYIKALKSVGDILVNYDYDKLIPVSLKINLILDVWIWGNSKN